MHDDGADDARCQHPCSGYRKHLGIERGAEWPPSEKPGSGVLLAVVAGLGERRIGDRLLLVPLGAPGDDRALRHEPARRFGRTRREWRIFGRRGLVDRIAVIVIAALGIAGQARPRRIVGRPFGDGPCLLAATRGRHRVRLLRGRTPVGLAGKVRPQARLEGSELGRGLRTAAPQPAQPAPALAAGRWGNRAGRFSIDRAGRVRRTWGCKPTPLGNCAPKFRRSGIRGAGLFGGGDERRHLGSRPVFDRGLDVVDDVLVAQCGAKCGEGG